MAVDTAITAEVFWVGSDGRLLSRVTTAGGAREGLAEVTCLFGYYSAVAIGIKLHRVVPKVF
jgi:hypothetical protein